MRRSCICQSRKMKQRKIQNYWTRRLSIIKTIIPKSIYMKLIKYITTAFLLVAVASFVLVSCYKEDAVPEASNTLTATSVTPLEGSSGTLITVTGTGLAQIKSVVF